MQHLSIARLISLIEKVRNVEEHRVHRIFKLIWTGFEPERILGYSTRVPLKKKLDIWGVQGAQDFLTDKEMCQGKGREQSIPELKRLRQLNHKTF